MKGPDDQFDAMKAWLSTLGERRPPTSARLTDELLAEVGPPPLPPMLRNASMSHLVDYAAQRSYGVKWAAKTSRQSWLAYREAEKMSDPAGMARAENAVDFWKDVSVWFEHQ